MLSAELRYQELNARSYDGGRAPAAFALDDAILADASAQESLATYCAYANATDELARCASVKHRLQKVAAPSEKPKPKAVLVAASLTHRQCGPEGPRDAIVAVRRIDGAPLVRRRCGDSSCGAHAAHFTSPSIWRRRR